MRLSAGRAWRGSWSSSCAPTRARGFARIELDVWSFNAGAVEFYEAMGFNTYRQLMELAI